MGKFIIEILQEIFSAETTYLILILGLYIGVIIRLRKLKERSSDNFCKNKLYSHSLINYIEYISHYKLRNIEHSDPGKEIIIRTLLKCFLDTLKKNVQEITHLARTKEFANYDRQEVANYLNDKFHKVLNDYKSLFRDKAEEYLDKDDIDLILRKFQEQNKSFVLSLGKIIIDIANSGIYRSNCEIVCGVLDLGLSSIIQVTLNVEELLDDVDQLKGKTFKGEKIIS